MAVTPSRVVAEIDKRFPEARSASRFRVGVENSTSLREILRLLDLLEPPFERGSPDQVLLEACHEEIRRVEQAWRTARDVTEGPILEHLEGRGEDNPLSYLRGILAPKGSNDQQTTQAIPKQGDPKQQGPRRKSRGGRMLELLAAGVTVITGAFLIYDRFGKEDLSTGLSIHVNQDLGPSKRLDIRSSSVTVSGRVEGLGGAGTRSIALMENGNQVSIEPIAPDGTFEIDIGLHGNVRGEYVLLCGSERLEFEVVQDSRPPTLEIVAPLGNPPRTGKSTVDLSLRVTDANLAKVELGNRLLARGPDGIWVASDVGLESEGPNVFTISAHDRAGNLGTVEALVVRDTEGPTLLSVPPADEVEGDRPLAFELAFDESLSGAFLANNEARISGSHARFELFVPSGSGAYTWSGEARDDLGNSRPMTWRVMRISPPVKQLTPEEARAPEEGTRGPAPEGWEVLDPALGFGGWARKVREPKSGIVLLLVEPGEFEMGSPPREAGRDPKLEALHRVVLTQAFYLGETEVTQEQYERITGVNPTYKFKGQPRFPVDKVSWRMATEFCKAIGCELPTEAQWEYACRAGTKTPFFFGETIHTDQANYDGQAYEGGRRGVNRKTLVEAGSLPPNAWGFHEMHGNMREWCRDGALRNYEILPTQDPFNDSDGNRILRGGSMGESPYRCRSAHRTWDSENSAYYATFRVSKTLR